jgi:hypothetical protein
MACALIGVIALPILLPASFRPFSAPTPLPNHKIQRFEERTRADRTRSLSYATWRSRRTEGIVHPARSSRATLPIINTGPVIPADQITRLLQPFQRLAPGRQPDGEGAGLGLSIATARNATLTINPRPRGPRHTSRFPRPPSPRAAKVRSLQHDRNHPQGRRQRSHNAGTRPCNQQRSRRNPTRHTMPGLPAQTGC